MSKRVFFFFASPDCEVLSSTRSKYFLARVIYGIENYHIETAKYKIKFEQTNVIQFIFEAQVQHQS